MALFKIFKGNSNNLGKTENGTNVAHEGFAYFTPDDGKFYIDIADANTAIINTNRIPLSADKADKIKQTLTNSDVNYKILLSNSSTPTTGDCDSVRYGANLIYNPSTNTFSTGNINLTGALDVIGNVDLHNQTSIDNLTAGTVLVTGSTNFSQIPTAPTAAAGTSNTQLATTEFVSAAVIAGNTDTKVTQTAVGDTYTNWRPLVIGASNNATEGFTPTTVTDSTFTTAAITVQPSSGTIKSTTYKGNATSAATLTTTRKINGINFNGSANVIFYGRSENAANTADKTVSISNFTLTTGAVVYVKFPNGNTANSPTLNINGTGAKNIYFQNGTRLETASNYPDYLRAGRIYEFVYDGTNYVLINNPNVLELYEKRTSTTDLNKTAIYGGAGAMFHMVATSSTTTGKPPTDANILQMNWDNNGGYDSQLGISTSTNRLYLRSRVSEGTAWREAATIAASTKTGNTDTPVYVNETGQVVAITGALANSITGNAATATKATQDGSGNNIVDTYLTKAAGVTAITWDDTNKKITKTINGTTTDVMEIKAGNGISLTAAAGEVTIDGYTVEVVRLI